jgi:predicted nucleotidyltransferase
MRLEYLQEREALEFLAEDPELLLAMVFGSTAAGNPRPDSDIDVAVYARGELLPCKRQELTDAIAMATGRTVDLIDLRTVNGVLLRRILRSGKLVVSKAPAVLGILSEQLLAWQEDFEPQLNELLARRLNRFIEPLHGS